MPVIIVEGIDGAGKSTLVENIKKNIQGKYDLVFWSKGVPKYDDPEQEYFRQLQWVRDYHFVVSDRYHVGELIYGPLYRGISRVAGKWFLAIEEKLDQLKAVKVVLLPELEVCKERAFSRGEDYLKEEDFDQVYDEYKAFLEDNEDWLHITDNSEEVAMQLIEMAKEGY